MDVLLKNRILGDPIAVKNWDNSKQLQYIFAARAAARSRNAKKQQSKLHLLSSSTTIYTVGRRFCLGNRCGATSLCAGCDQYSALHFAEYLQYWSTYAKHKTHEECLTKVISDDTRGKKMEKRKKIRKKKGYRKFLHALNDPKRLHIPLLQVSSEMLHSSCTQP